MAEPSPGQRISRRRWLLAGLAAPLFRVRAADNLIVTFDGDNVHVSSFGVHFLKGKSLQRLKDGSAVTYLAALTLYRDAFLSPIRRSEFRFSISYDVLGAGDQFAVAMPGPHPRRATNLSQSATETWCLENAGISALGIGKDTPFWLKLELKIVVPKLNGLGPGPFINILDFVTPPGDEERQSFPAGPLRLSDLVHTGKGRRG
jgi:hypothetical protein